MTDNSRHIGRYGRTLAGVLSVVLLSTALQSCFTGIESTPKITYKEVRKQVVATPERDYALNFRADSFARWEPGRMFLLTDPRGSITYLPPAGKRGEMAEGDTVVYRGTRSFPSILGGEEAEMVFTLLHQPTDTFLYRPGGDASELTSGGVLRLPFMVDLAQVAKTSRLLVGKELYTRTERWYSPAGEAETSGRKFVKVRITDVVPATEDYPFFIRFSCVDNPAETGGLKMAPTVEEGAPAMRGFENLFLLEDPRVNYPSISDSRWELIRRGKVELGMTTNEAHLALGSPSDVISRPDQSIFYERWGYPGGIYLIFEDGVLTRTNL